MPFLNSVLFTMVKPVLFVIVTRIFVAFAEASWLVRSLSNGQVQSGKEANLLFKLNVSCHACIMKNMFLKELYIKIYFQQIDSCVLVQLPVNILLMILFIHALHRMDQIGNENGNCFCSIIVIICIL